MKPFGYSLDLLEFIQPPSGGCVLKLVARLEKPKVESPAAFGRLCVETLIENAGITNKPAPAAFGRLCVETGNAYSLPVP